MQIYLLSRMNNPATSRQMLTENIYCHPPCIFAYPIDLIKLFASETTNIHAITVQKND